MPSENIRKTIKYTAGPVRIIIIQAGAVHFSNPTFFSLRLRLWTYLGCCFIPRLKLFINFICSGQIHWTWDQRLLKNKNFYFLHKYLWVTKLSRLSSPSLFTISKPTSHSQTDRTPSINLMIWRTTPSAQQRAFVKTCICGVWGVRCLVTQSSIQWQGSNLGQTKYVYLWVAFALILFFWELAILS